MQLKYWFPHLLLCALFATGLSKVNVSEQAAFVEALLTRSDYNPRVIPALPTIVDLDFFINSISSINEVNMDYTMSIYMRQSWIDPRLTFVEYNDTLTLSFDQIRQLWVPDLFFRNEKKASFHVVTVPNRLITVSPQGRVNFSQRLSLTLSCEMDLVSYPMDNQTCSVEIETFGYNTKELILKWKNIPEPVQVRETLQLPEFVLDRENIELGDCTTPYLTGSFSCQFARLKFLRQFHYYMIQVYIPTVLVVMLSWVSFWIDMNAVPARVTLGLVTVLTMTTQNAGISSRLPRVSYVKAIDIWMTACLALVFGGIVEYAIVNVLARKQKSKQESARPAKESYRLIRDGGPNNNANNDEIALQVKSAPDIGVPRNRKSSTLPDSNQGSMSDCESHKEHKRSLLQKVRSNKALLVDVISRFLFPLVFVVFNIVYWNVYQVSG